uniref:Cytochrome P450, family 17, subfamily A, polypeptide 1 n=1 Tax=Cyprinus carpio TaxID=7962 RepID=A0A8C2A5N3_CYPCA
LTLPWLLCSFLFSAVTLAALYLKRKMNGFVPGDRSPPSLPSLPILGSLLSLVTDSPPHIFFQQLQKKYGVLYSLVISSHKVLIVNNHHHAKEVLIKKGKIFAGRPQTVTTDLLTRDGKDIAFADYSSTWKFHWKMVHGALCVFGEGSVSIEKIIEYHCVFSVT